MFEGPVIGAFGIRGEAAGGKFPAAQVILQAFAAGALSRTGFIAAVTVILVLFQFAIHSSAPLNTIESGIPRLRPQLARRSPGEGGAR